jgi:hypothetical protein
MNSTSICDEKEEVQEDVEQDELECFVTVDFDRVTEDTRKEDDADDEMASLKSQIQSQIDTLGESYQRKMTGFDVAYSREVAPLYEAYAKISETEARAYSDRVKATLDKTRTFRHDHSRVRGSVTVWLFFSVIICFVMGFVSASIVTPCWSNQYWDSSLPVCEHANFIAARISGKQATATPTPPQCSSLTRHRWYQKNASELCDAEKMVAFRGSWSEFFDELRCVVVPLLIFNPLILVALTEHGVYSLFYYDRRYRAVWLSEFSDVRLRVSERRLVRRFTRLLALVCFIIFSLGELCRRLNFLDSVEMQWCQMIFCAFANFGAWLQFNHIFDHSFIVQIPFRFLVQQDGYWQMRKYESGEFLPGFSYPYPPLYDQDTVIIYWT